MLLADWKVRIGKNGDSSQFFPIRNDLKAANNIFYLFPSCCKLAYKFFTGGFVYATLPLNRLTRRLQYKPFAKNLTNKRANKSNTIQRKMY